MNIYFIRHGRQNDGRCNVDVELSKEGHEQAKLVGQRLREYGIDCLYASELIRAQQTAQHIGEAVHLPVKTMENIEEIHFGQWTGRTDEELESIWSAERNGHRTGTLDVAYPDGESGESCSLRFQKGMDAILRDAEAKKAQKIVVVTHGMALRAWLCKVFEIPFYKRGVLAKSLENGSITEVRIENGVFSLERFNDYAHLEPYDALLRKHFK